MAEFKAHANAAVMTGAEVGAMSVGAIIGVKWLSRDHIFRKSQEGVEPEMWEFREGYDEKSFAYRHWGGIKFAGAAFLSTYVENPWLKLIIIGIAIEGAIQELRVLSHSEEDDKFAFEKIGANEDVNQQLKDAAKNYLTQGVTDQYSSAVGAVTDQYSSAVGMPMLQDNSVPYGVGAMGELYSG